MNDFNDDPFLDVCENIEHALKMVYEMYPDMSDNLCMLGLDNAKIAIKQEFGFAKNEQVSSAQEIEAVVTYCVSLGKARMAERPDLSLKEFVARLDKIKRSIARHNVYGSRGYYEFIRKYV